MNRTRTRTTMTRLRKALALLAAFMAILLTWQATPNAWAATTGFDANGGKIHMSYGSGATVENAWLEDVLTVDSEWVYCVAVDETFASGIEVSREDPVATGKWSQEMTTELALAAEYVWDGKFRSSASSGSHLVTDGREKYAITQVMIWEIMNRYGFSNHEWFGAGVDDTSLTGADDGRADCMAYVEANKATRIGHANYYQAVGAQSVACGFWTEEVRGSIALEKRSANASITKGNGCYSLKGAVYGVFGTKKAARSHKAGEALHTYKTGADGTWTSGSDFAPGTYYVAETKAPEGYVLDDAVYEVTVEAGKQAKVNASPGYVSDVPKSNPVTVWAAKQDAQTADHGAQGSASLAGTLFEIAYYDGYYKSSNLPSKATRTWVVTCGDDGKAYVRDDLKVSGDDFYRTEDGKVTVPLGTVVVREKAAPDGYREAGSDDAKLIKITSDDEGATVGVYTAPTFKNQVMRGGVAVGKVDRQNGRYIPQGAATLAGATFEIVTDNDQQVIVDGTRYTRGDVVKVIETELTGGKYFAQTSADCLPVGTYTVRETASSPGYAYDRESQEWAQTFEVSADGQVVDLTDPADAVGNQVVRGDFGFSKVDGLTDVRIGNVPFLVTSNTTGESHVLMGDANGMASTAASWNPHSARTNGNDKAVSFANGRYAVDEKLLDDEAGIWFNGSAEAECTPDDELGALPYDTYTVTELPVAANAEYDLVTFTVGISRHGRELDLGTVDDNPKPSIGTSLADGYGAPLVPADGEAALVDTVQYMNLDVRSTYTLKGTLYAVVGDEGAETVSPVAEKAVTFTPRSAIGAEDVAFAFDASALSGARLVAFEELYGADGELVAEHADLSDEGQTVRVPSIGTTLADSASATHESPSCGTIELIDTVSYHGLKPGIAYTVTGALHVRGEDGSDAGEALDEQGDAIVASQSFTPESSDGSVEVAFTFSAPALGGSTVVAFEELQYRDVTYAVHADIADEPQSVRMPGIGTTLVNGADGTHDADADEAITLVDAVSYRGLTPGETYTVTGVLHLRSADGTDAGPALDKDGNEIAATETFVPESDSGTVSVTFAFAAPDLAGNAVVAFEELARNGRTYAVHADIADEGQTVKFAPPEEKEGEPPKDEPPAETPPKEEPPIETPPTETTPPGKTTLPKTGDELGFALIAFGVLGAAGTAAVALYMRREQQGEEITIARGPDRT